MQLRTFSADSSAKVLTQIRDELGPDAIILDTKEKNGVVTMTAALERGAGKAPSAAGKASPGSAASAMPGTQETPPGWRQWHQEWDSIRSHLLSLMKPALKLDELSPRQRVALEYLQRQGIDDESTLAIVSGLRDKKDASILDPLGEIVSVKPLGHKRWKEHIHIIAGPFGTGKTSVAVRTALLLRKENSDTKVCLINADATRGNGRLLLRHYSELSEFAYKEAASTIELIKAIAKAESENFDKIIIDLPGIAKNKSLQALVADCGLLDKAVAVHLVLPPQYSATELRAILGRYKTSVPGSVIWTKLDEAEQYGPLVNVAVQTGLPVSALSYGPGMGNSLVSAKETLLWRLIFKNELPGDD